MSLSDPRWQQYFKTNVFNISDPLGLSYRAMTIEKTALTYCDHIRPLVNYSTDHIRPLVNFSTDHIRPLQLVNSSTDHAEAGALREATAEEGAGAGVGDHNAVVRRQELYTRAAE